MRNQVQAVLGDTQEVTEDTNLIEAGLSSLSLMRLMSKWRKCGVKVTFSTLISKPYLKEWKTCLPKEEQKEDNVEQQALWMDQEDQEPFAMTDVQYAYWVGRKKNQILGGIGCHAYIEVDGREIDPEKLKSAWRSLLRKHPMLRVKFLSSGHQQYMDEPYSEEVTIYHYEDCTEDELAERLGRIRKMLSHRQFKIEKGEVAGLALAMLPQQNCKLFFDIDLLVSDVHSFQIILSDLAHFYVTGEEEKRSEWSFRKYLLLEEKKKKEEVQAAKEYWLQRMEQLPLGPQLPLCKEPVELKNVVFHAKKRILSLKDWKQIKQYASGCQVTPSMVLLTAYCLVLKQYSATDEFLINIPMFNRDTDIEGIEDVVADFTTLLLLPFRYVKGETFAETVKRISETFYQEMAHSAYSGVQVVRELAKRYGNDKSIAPVVFACNIDTKLVNEEFEKAFGNLSYIISQTPQVWLDFQMYEENQELLLKWDAVEELFPEGILDSMFDDLLEMLVMAASRDWNFSADTMLEKQHVILGDVVDYEDKMCCLQEGFFVQARNQPKEPAFIDTVSGKTLCYKEAADCVLRIAGAITQYGLQEERIGISLPRGTDQILAALGILASGNCYVPIHMNHPAERKGYITRQAQIQLLLTDISGMEQLPADYQGKVLDIQEAKEQKPLEMPVCRSVDSMAYIIFTSGSTGNPKGVEITHRNAMNTILDINSRYGVNKKDRVLAISAMDFDLSVYDVFGTLSAGAALVVFHEEQKKDAVFWSETVTKYGITIWNSVPALMEMLTIVGESEKLTFPSLRRVLLSGDWIPLDLPSRIQKIAPNVQITSLGGATEAAIWSNFYEVELPISKKWKSIPYGTPLSNQSFRIVDEAGKDCPCYVKGELWIGGAGVARGYCKEETLTKKQFVWDQNERWYRTGDMGCYWQDGTIEFLGRNDFQVKVNGFRIELGEVEKKIKAHPDVQDVKVIAKKQKQGTFLVAYVVGTKRTSGQKELSEKDLLEYARENLPAYMVPTVFQRITKFPLSGNGKVDVQALQNMELEWVKEPEAEEPKAGMESQLAELWKEVLGRNVIGRTDNYFTLGGDSLSATSLSMRIDKELGIAFSLEDIFQHPVLKAQAEVLRMQKAKEGKENDLLPELLYDEAGRFEPFPLSDIQVSYWIGSQGAHSLGQAGTLFYYELECKFLNVKQLEKAWQQLIVKHDMMRAVILQDGLNQKVLEEVPYYEIMQLDARNDDEVLTKTRKRLSHRHFNHVTWPLFEVVTTRVSEKMMHIHLCFDNIMFDGFSIAMLLKEWAEAYQNPDSPIRIPAVSYRDYVRTVALLKETPMYQRDKEYWEEKLANMPAHAELPLAKASDQVKNQRFTHREKRYDREAYARLSEMAGKRELTVTVLLLTIYGMVLQRFSNQQRFTINLTRFHRIPFEDCIQEVVGDFTALTLHTLDMQKNQSFAKQATQVQETLMKDLSHPYFSGVEVIREYGSRHEIIGREIMPIVFTSALGFGKLGDESSLFGKHVYNASETPQVWLDHQILDDNDELCLTWDFIEELFPEGMIADFLTAYTSILDKLLEGEEAWDTTEDLMELARLSEREEANQTKQSLKAETMLTRFQEQVRRQPDKSAVEAGNESVSYQQLNQRANGIAEWLVEQGIGENDLVAICMEKGWEQVVAVVAVLKAGAAYFPIDVSNPNKRTQELLDIGQCKVIITTSYAKDWKEFKEQYQIVMVDQFAYEKASGTEWNCAKKDALAYVICTSGTTGKPKGVMITHQSAMNTILDVNEKFQVTDSDKAIALSNLNFDLSVYDIFGMLSAGGTIVMPDYQVKKEPKHWIRLLVEKGVTVWNTVPAYMEMLVEYLKTQPPVKSKLRLALLSGDWIAPTLPDAMKVTFEGIRVVGLGGATEASIWSNYYEVKEQSSEWSSIPYGKPLANQRFYILNQEGKQSPVWVPGDLYIAGDGLAQGYWKEEEKTREKFFVHQELNQRLYATGDMGRYLPGGNIEFLGRVDNQVKIRGYRIELGEIESVLEHMEGIKNAVVTTVGSRSTQQLAASIILNEHGKELYTEVREEKKCNQEEIELFQGEEPLSAEAIKRIEQFYQYLDAASMIMVLHCLEYMDLPVEQDETFTMKELEAKVADSYKTFTTGWITQFEEDGILIREGENFHFTENPMTYYQNLQKESVAEAYAKDCQRVTELLNHNLLHYISVLKGTRDALTFYLDEEGLTPDTLGAFSKYSSKAVEVVQSGVEKLMKAEETPQKVVELGTRTERLFPKLAPIVAKQGGNYVYAEESDAFLDMAKRDVQEEHVTFVEADFARTDVVEKMHFEADIVVANNTLHRAKDLDKTLGNIGKTLKQGGMLIIVEQMDNQRFIRNTVGLFQANTEKSNVILYTADNWKQMLEAHEFQICETYIPSNKESGMVVLAARYTGKHRIVLEDKLKQDIMECLPEYMVPQYYNFLDNYPLTANGKVDIKQLKEGFQEQRKEEERTVEKPVTYIEQQLYQIWSKILKKENFSIQDRFFELGGDSLKAIYCINEVKKNLSVELTLKELFHAQTVKRLAVIIEERSGLGDSAGEIYEMGEI